MKDKKINNANKNLRYFLWTIFGMMLLAGLGLATTISDTDSSFGGDINATGNISAAFFLGDGQYLNTNSSAFWDNLNSPSDINAGDITDDGTYYDTSSNINAFGYNITATNLNITGTANIGDLTWNGNLDLGGNDLLNVAGANFSTINSIIIIEKNNGTDLLNNILNLNDNTVIQIPCGTYDLGNSKAYSGAQNIAIKGSGLLCTHIISSWAGTPKDGGIFFYNTTNIELSEFKYTITTGRDAIELYNVTKAHINNIYVEGNKSSCPAGEYFGIHAEDLQDSLITNSYFTGHMFDVGVRTDVITSNQTLNARNTISNNHFFELGNSSCSDSISTGTAIEIEAQDDGQNNRNIVSNNHMYNIAGHGVRYNDCVDCLVYGNYIENVGHSGLWIVEGNSLTYGNYIINATQEDIEVIGDNNFIYGNVLRGGNTNPINVWAGYSNNTFYNNWILENDNSVIDNGNNTLFVLNKRGWSDNLGIGTINPGSELSVDGSIELFGSNENLLIKQSEGGTEAASIGYYSGNGGALALRDNSGNLKNFIRGYGDVYFTSGNVGIGTTSPQNTLNVIGDINSTTNIIAGGNLTLGQKITFTLGETIDNIADGIIAITGKLSITDDLIVNTDKFFVNATSGNVGIGTTSPTSGAGITRFLEIYEGSSVGLKIGNAAYTFETYVASDTNNLYVYSNAGAGNMLVLEGDTGNVGIGTTTPQNKLNIIGDGNFTTDLTVGSNLTIGGNQITINSLPGITGNHTNGNCWTSYTGGVATGTNCTAY